MPRLIWSRPALLDTHRLYQFLAAKNLDAAKRAVKAIRDGVKILAHQPAMGRPIPDLEPQFREWPIDFGDSGYIVMYRTDGLTAVILAVRHQKEAGY
jgi:plasmid stabilization system protein ParE